MKFPASSASGSELIYTQSPDIFEQGARPRPKISGDERHRWTPAAARDSRTERVKFRYHIRCNEHGESPHSGILCPNSSRQWLCARLGLQWPRPIQYVIDRIHVAVPSNVGLVFPSNRHRQGRATQGRKMMFKFDFGVEDEVDDTSVAAIASPNASTGPDGAEVPAESSMDAFCELSLDALVRAVSTVTRVSLLTF